MLDLKELSSKMKVSETDILSLAKSIINSMEKDKAIDYYLGSSKEMQLEFVLAYASQDYKKIRSFETKYYNNPEASECFQRRIFTLLNDLSTSQ